MTLQELVDLHAAGTSEDVRARYQGALLGVVVGNALGLPAEFRRRRELAAEYPDGIREIEPRLRNEPVDDDVAQAITIADASLTGRALSVDDLAQRLVMWMEENGRGAGFQTVQVLEQISSGTPPDQAARLVWEKSGRTAAGNGAVMRCAPVGMRWRRDGAALVENAITSALVTHYDERCLWSTAVVSVIVAIALSGSEVSVAEIARSAEASGAPEACVMAITTIDGRDIADFEHDGPDMGYTLKTMQFALWALQTQLDLEAALVHTVMQGGDADTNGAVVGAVMGARAGIQAIPQRWLARAPETDRIARLADELLEQSLRQ